MTFFRIGSIGGEDELNVANNSNALSKTVDDSIKFGIILSCALDSGKDILTNILITF